MYFKQDKFTNNLQLRMLSMLKRMKKSLDRVDIKLSIIYNKLSEFIIKQPQLTTDKRGIDIIISLQDQTLSKTKNR